LLLLVLLAGCESMSESQCRVADWQRVGHADGAAGVAESRLANYSEDCGKIGISPNAQAYRRGWDAGIVQFCTAANGWRQGVEGYSAKESVCIGQAGYAQFALNLRAGLQVHRTNERIRDNNDEIRRLQQHLESTTDDTERKAIRAELYVLDREQYRLRLQLGQLRMLAP